MLRAVHAQSLTFSLPWGSPCLPALHRDTADDVHLEDRRVRRRTTRLALDDGTSVAQRAALLEIGRVPRSRFDAYRQRIMRCLHTTWCRTNVPETNWRMLLPLNRLDHDPFDDGEFKVTMCPPGVCAGVEGFEGGENGLPCLFRGLLGSKYSRLIFRDATSAAGDGEAEDGTKHAARLSSYIYWRRPPSGRDAQHREHFTPRNFSINRHREEQ